MLYTEEIICQGWLFTWNCH